MGSLRLTASLVHRNGNLGYGGGEDHENDVTGEGRREASGEEESQPQEYLEVKGSCKGRGKAPSEAPVWLSGSQRQSRLNEHHDPQQKNEVA